MYELRILTCIERALHTNRSSLTALCWFFIGSCLYDSSLRNSITYCHRGL